MLENTVLQFEMFISKAKTQISVILYIIATLWAINLLNFLLRYRLNIFGLLPRRISGIPGIFISPLLHGNFNHVFFNSIPLFVLGLYMLTLGNYLFICSTFVIILFGGAAVWLCGRAYLHIGASGLISGYFSFVIGIAYIQPTISTLFIAIIALYYFGGIILGLLPTEEGTSWESHLAGFMAGILAVYLCIYNHASQILLLKVATALF